MTKRINTGLYEFETFNGKFEVERFPDGSWMLFRIHALPCAEPREYVNDFTTKADAVLYASANAPFANEAVSTYDGCV